MIENNYFVNKLVDIILEIYDDLTEDIFAEVFSVKELAMVVAHLHLDLEMDAKQNIMLKNLISQGRKAVYIFNVEGAKCQIISFLEQVKSFYEEYGILKVK